MKIVVLDGFTLNPGDLNWEVFGDVGELIVFDRTRPELILDRCAEADIVLTNKVAFSEELLKKLPLLKLLCVTATGYNIIDIAAARALGVTVCNVPDYGTDSVAQHTFALILELSNQVGLHCQSVLRGDWQRSSDFSYSLSPLLELSGKTLGIIGFGSIGKRTASIARAFGMKVNYYTPRQKDTDLAEYASLENIFAGSDFISLHLPLKSDNFQFVNASRLALMKPTAFLINTSRGQLVNEHDLAEALNNRKIAGAAVDVLSEEPPLNGSPLLQARNCVITPHNAWMSIEARRRIMEITYHNVAAFLNGQPVNVVS